MSIIQLQYTVNKFTYTDKMQEMYEKKSKKERKKIYNMFAERATLK